MNATSICLATLAGTVTYFVFGGVLMFATGERLKGLYKEHAAVYRPENQIMKYFPLAIGTMLLSIAVVTVLFARIHPGGAGWMAGAKLGAAMGTFVMFAHTGHEFATINIGPKLAVTNAAMHFIQWVLVCIAMALAYRP